MSRPEGNDNARREAKGVIIFELCPIKYSNLNSIILKRFLETLVLVFIGFLKFLLITLLL